jgi:release factor glutamine methyltransferase
VGFDLSGEALALARRNAVRNDVAERLGLVGGDLLLAAATGRYDLIVSNPPYIATAEIAFLQPEVRDFEPRLALDGGPDGLAAYRALCAQARRALKPGGSLAFEVGQGQAPHVAALLHQAGFDRVETRHDLAGIERVVVAHREL